MEPEENRNELEPASESTKDSGASEVFRAEVVSKDTPGPDSGPEVGESTEDQAESDSLASDANTQMDGSESVGSLLEGASFKEGERLWGDAELVSTNSGPKPPYLGITIAAKILFALSGLMSAAFLIWFVWWEITRLNNGVVIFQQSLVLVFVLFGSIYGFFRVQRKHVSVDTRAAAFILLALAGATLIYITPAGWTLVGTLWIGLLAVTLVLSLMSPLRDYSNLKITFDVNEGLAANGGSVAAVVLGGWAMIGAFFTSFSVINAVLGIALGLWGLTSRKKALAIFGIVLCALAIFACMTNVTVLFWNMIQIPEEELL